MLALPITTFVNHVLSRESWARERLLPFAGKRLRVHTALADLLLQIDAEGYVRAGQADAGAVDLELDLPLDAWFALLRKDEAAMRAIRIRGDTEMAAALQFLFLNVRWDMEEDLSRVVGDVAAHRVMEGGRAFMQWQRDSAQRLGDNLAEYWREEAHLLTPRAEVESFIAATADLRDALARLEKRIEKFESGLPPNQ
ncbi:MAG TPA: SCP2 sterol-binding domain-containing protein [Burkholderiales bacterium]|jgi:ubiquinone biosynthesis accessory factor UbiJ|nr:SCP2 sterol-binding domain-containing protein [Burkholderiales bacterium]